MQASAVIWIAGALGGWPEVSRRSMTVVVALELRMMSRLRAPGVSLTARRVESFGGADSDDFRGVDSVIAVGLI